ncbi:tyrosine-type recombinase/integrase [Paraburkholderia heleia]|uniref:tyrosine-type recombinase/integrase n=1 Tax=Paraburkholderia heleia TaxID=634127 RepID=UPI002AB5F35B|nr:tyrosine-type recombinase/integrase [Paraburkholderia heleia]
MNKENFTPERVAGYQCAPDRQQSIFWDKKQSGLGVRVTQAGSKAYIFEGRLFGKTVRLTIGAPDAWPLERYVTTDKATGEKIERMGARQEAARLKALMDRDIDPREEKIQQRAAHEIRKAAARRQDVHVDEVWSEYLKANQARWSERHYRDHENLAQAGGEKKKRGKGLTVAGPLAPLMPLKLASLNARTVAAWLQSESEVRPTNAAQSYRKLRAFIRWCDDHADYAGIVPPDAYSARSVRETVPRSNVKDDCLQREQLTAWFGAARKIDNPVISSYLQGLLITGARREELAALRWDDVDFRWRSLHLSDKVEVETGRTIPLTPYLASLLLELKRINETPPNTRQLRRLKERDQEWVPSPWVFWSKTSADGKLAEPRIAHTKALDAAGLPHVSLHGLRRSFGTLSEWCEVPVGVVAQIQGHKPSALAEKHYRRRPLDLLRSWHDKIESWILEQAKIKFEPVTTDKGLQAVDAA